MGRSYEEASASATRTGPATVLYPHTHIHIDDNIKAALNQGFHDAYIWGFGPFITHEPRFFQIYDHIHLHMAISQPKSSMGRTKGTVEKILNQADVALVAQQACAAMDELQKASLAVAPAKLFDEFATKRISFDMFGMRF